MKIFLFFVLWDCYLPHPNKSRLLNSFNFYYSITIGWYLIFKTKLHYYKESAVRNETGFLKITYLGCVNLKIVPYYYTLFFNDLKFFRFRSRYNLIEPQSSAIARLVAYSIFAPAGCYSNYSNMEIKIDMDQVMF